MKAKIEVEKIEFFVNNNKNVVFTKHDKNWTVTVYSHEKNSYFWITKRNPTLKNAIYFSKKSG